MEFLRSHLPRSAQWLFAFLLSVSVLNAAAPAIDSALTDSTTVDQPYTYTITATNAPTGYAAANLPVGLSRSGSVISGTPTAAGVFSITIVAQNVDGSDVQTLELTIEPIAPKITSPDTASGNVGEPFNFTVTAINDPDSLSVDGLDAFPGLSFDSATGVISGTPTATASGDLIVEASNSAPGNDVQILTLTIEPAVNAAPVITSPLTEEATVGSAFSYTINATNSPSSYSLAGDPLPQGLSRSGNVISGTPTQTGVFNIELVATNQFGSGSATLSLDVDDAPVITSPASASGYVGEPFSYTVTAENNPSSFSIAGINSFPGLSFNAGVISGTPTVTASGNLVVSATNSSGTGTLTVRLTIGAPLSPVIISSLDEEASVGSAFSYTIEATNAPTSYSLAGDALPGGLSRSGNVISGTPTETGIFNIELIATNKFGSGSATLILNVDASNDPVITSPNSAAGSVGQTFSYTVTAENAPTSFSIIGLEAFPGLSFNTVTGEISGIPTTANTDDVVVSATNPSGTGSLVVTLTIAPALPPEITSSLNETVSVGDFYFYTIEALNAPTSYSIIDDSLPDGLSLFDNFISGSITETGVYEIQLVATNEFGFDSATLTLNVSSTAPVITSPTSATGNVGQPFNYTVTAINDPASFTVYGLAAYPGLSFDPNTGVISGVPTAAVSDSVFVEATNGSGTGTAIISLTIFDPANSAPVITSSLSETTTAGDFFTYTIEAINAPLVYGIAGDGLPEGLSRSGNIISGNPTESGIFNIEITAANSFGSDSKTLELEVIDAAPAITSLLTAVGDVGEDFTYQITTSSDVDTYSAVGLNSIGGLSIDQSSGLISGTPVNSGSYDILISASNSAGTDQRVLTLIILEVDSGTGPAVNIVSINGESPGTNLVFDNTTTSLNVVVEVTPDTGEMLETVYLQWTNPPSSSGFNDIILVELEPVGPIPATGPVTYEGGADIGFEPTNREIGGGQIELEAIATQRSPSGELSFGTSNEEMVVIEPLIKFLLPEEGVFQESIPAGGAFTVVRLSTNAFSSVTATISGVGTIETVEDNDNSDNGNGVFSFNVSSLVAFPAVYTIVVQAEDTFGNLVEITRDFEIVSETSSPVAVIASPTPGFRNDVFSPGSFTWFLESDSFETNDEGVITKSTYVYILEPVSRGQGYYPRNQSDARLSYTFYDNEGDFAARTTVDGNTVENGRVVLQPETVTFTYNGFVPSFGLNGIGIIDRYEDSGINSRIDIVADLFRADSPLQSFRMFINGEDVTPGNGNLNPDSGPVAVPVLTYPSTGSLAPGEYVVTAEVTDQDGEVGVSRPLVFTIDPFEELDVTMTADAVDEVDQGDTVTYLVEVAPNDSLDTVEVLDSVTNEILGFASRVTINGEIFYRFTRTYDEAGIFGIYARATTFSGQQVISNQISLDVQPFNDAVVAITSPQDDTTLTFGQSLTFSAEASASPGIASITWFVNNNPELTVEESSSSFNFVTGSDGFAQGTYNITVSTIDNFGNQVGSNESIEVSVVASNITVSITSPASGQTVFEGGQLDFSATASANVGISSLEWFVNGTSVETDTSAPYSLSQTFSSAGNFSVLAEATDELGNTASSAAITVTALPSNPLLRDDDFVTDIYDRLLGFSPTSDQLAEALAQLDGTLTSRSQYLVDLLQTDDFENTISAFIIYRTMTGEWPDKEESEQAIQDLFGEFNQTSEFTGTILPFGTVSHTLNFGSVGTRVRARVEGDSANAFGLTDPTLQVFGPQGFIAFDDDSGFSLNPEIIFNVAVPGTHTFFVGGFSSRAGEYVLTVESFGDENEVGEVNASALTSALQPEYIDRFGTFNAVNSTITQLFENKHSGASPTALTQNRLLSAASQNYPGDFISFVTDFALDNDLSNFVGPDDLPLTSVLLYSQPNNPEGDALLAALIARLLGVEPTNATIANLAANTLAESVEIVLTDERYFGQFDTSNIEGEVAQYMAGFGIFDLSQNGLGDDPDGDGFDNQAEFNASTDPLDATDFPTNWYAGADVLSNDWRYFDWFNAFKPMPGGWIYHVEHGWLYVAADDTSSIFIYDSALNRWLWTSESVYPWIYLFGPDEGWFYYFENGSPGARSFARGSDGQILTEDDLSVNP